MKIGGHLLAVLTFGGLSMHPAVARHHHGYHVGGSTAAAVVSGPGTPNQAKSATANASQQGSAPASEGATERVKASGSGKGAADQTSSHSKTSKSGVTPTTDTGTAPANAHGHLHGVTPGGTPQSGSAARTDTGITVHQGRNALMGSREAKEIKDIKARLSGKPKTAVAPGTAAAPANPIATTTAPAGDATHQRAHDGHKVPVRPDGGQPRNAVGAVIGTSAQHPNSATGNAPATANAPAPTTGSAPPGSTAIGPHTKPLAGNGPASSSGTGGATQIGSHAPGSAALAIAATSGPSINGTGMIRPGSSTGAIGGTAKILAGVIGGNGFRPKHP
jgi:hypothetical protein